MQAVFFISYLIFQVPANIVLGRLGARLWISLILAAWGIISAATAFVEGPTSFAILRFLLGVAEAGFFPGMMFYLTLWFPQAYRARLSAFFITAQPLAFIAGGPLSGMILTMDGVGGLHGWQWLFLIEGLPAVMLAFFALRWLPDGPAQAEWLRGDEKATIFARLRAESPADANDTMWSAFREPRVWLIAVPIFSAGLGAKWRRVLDTPNRELHGVLQFRNRARRCGDVLRRHARDHRGSLFERPPPRATVACRDLLADRGRRVHHCEPEPDRYRRFDCPDSGYLRRAVRYRSVFCATHSLLEGARKRMARWH